MEPRITFGLIVLSGRPFIIPNVKSLYPYAHQIIVVEGACEAARSIAREDGHSIDGTYEDLLEFKRTSDPDDKVKVVTAADAGFQSGFWPDKNAMSWAYASAATGNYLWQIDADEFYTDDDMTKLISLLAEDRYDTVSFETKTFFGGLEYELDGFYFRRDRGRVFHRLFRWGPGYQYKTHWPPTVIDENGTDLRALRWMGAEESARMGIFMYHYCYLFTQQVTNKMTYYDGVRTLKSQSQGKPRLYSRYAEAFSRGGTRPFRVHGVQDHLSWIRRYRGGHPQAILDMIENLKNDPSQSSFRDNTDVESWLSSISYRASCAILEAMARAQCHQPFNLMYKVWLKLARLARPRRATQ